MDKSQPRDSREDSQQKTQTSANSQKTTDNDISAQELDMLDNAGVPNDDDKAMHKADLDGTDEEGTPLNEKASGRDRSGRDLDVPGSKNDNDMEDIGSEDEENNSYSLKDGEV
jgi:hypothetical protein